MDREKIGKFILSRKWSIAIITVLVIALVAVVMNYIGLTNQINSKSEEQPTQATISTISETEPTEATKESKPQESESVNSSEIEKLKEENEKLRKMVQGEVGSEQLEVELSSAVEKYLKAFYEYSEKDTTMQEHEETVKATVTDSCFKKYFRPDNAGSTAFIIMADEESSYKLDSMYFSDLNTEAPKVAAMFNTKLDSPNMDKPLYSQMFQVYTMKQVDGEWKIDKMKDATSLKNY